MYVLDDGFGVQQGLDQEMGKNGNAWDTMRQMRRAIDYLEAY
jgi:hypothetical protein